MRWPLKTKVLEKLVHFQPFLFHFILFYFCEVIEHPFEIRIVTYDVQQ